MYLDDGRPLFEFLVTFFEVAKLSPTPLVVFGSCSPPSSPPSLQSHRNTTRLDSNQLYTTPPSPPSLLSLHPLQPYLGSSRARGAASSVLHPATAARVTSR